MSASEHLRTKTEILSVEEHVAQSSVHGRSLKSSSIIPVRTVVKRLPVPSNI